jgi:hypothetical protein
MAPHETKRLRALATQVAERLGYHVEPKFSEQVVVTKGGHDVCLCWRIACHPNDGIVISGQFPRLGRRGERALEPRDPLSITVSADSTAEHVEAEIRGRLLHGYLVQLERVRAERGGQRTYDQEQDRVAQLLCAAGAEPRPGRGHLRVPLPSRPERWPCAYIEVARYSDDVTIELRHLSPEQAANVISLLARQATGGAEG